MMMMMMMMVNEKKTNILKFIYSISETVFTVLVRLCKTFSGACKHQGTTEKPEKAIFNIWT